MCKVIDAEVSQVLVRQPVHSKSCQHGFAQSHMHKGCNFQGAGS